jgi:hypothetical protein
LSHENADKELKVEFIPREVGKFIVQYYESQIYLNNSYQEYRYNFHEMKILHIYEKLLLSRIQHELYINAHLALTGKHVDHQS